MIRRAGIDDQALLIDLHRQFCEADHHPFSERRANIAFSGLLADDRHGAVWLAGQPNSTARGYAVLTWAWSIEAGGAEAVLDEIFVADRGHGVGTALMDHVVADARQRGLARIFLETERHNDRVRSFYSRHGFAADDSIWMSREFIDLTTS